LSSGTRTHPSGPAGSGHRGQTCLSNAEIAKRLYLSHATVKTHINRIFAKTGARDRAQAVRYAYQHGLTTPAQ
jgi:DNA-binding CsgD family transcriptional regulator